MIELQDRKSRQVKYLRVSVTDRCNFRCRYCMPERMSFMPRTELLSFEEMAEIVSLFVELGVSHVRITGGEPLARRDIVELVGLIARIDGVEDLAMTTNGALLESLAKPLVEAGLKRINVSIDTLDAARFEDITRWGQLELVLAGIRAARDAGMSPVKLNAVLVKGVNDDEAGDLVRFARDEGLIMRFIEYMPIGIDGWWNQSRFLRMSNVRDVLVEQGFSVRQRVGESPVGGGPAQYWDVVAPGSTTAVPVGFIAALTHNFCERCNRVRLTSDGRVRECLTSGGALSLRDMLRGGASREEMVAAIQNALYGKVEGHGFDASASGGGRNAFVSMSALGG